MQAGVTLQLLSIVTEALRLVFIQLLLQRQGVTLNPVSTMYYIAPACLLCLLPIAAMFESSVLRATLSKEYQLSRLELFLINGIGAVSLNLTVFLVLGQLPALMMNDAGVVKDWLLIFVSCLCFSSSITATQLAGYALAFSGVSKF